MFLFTIRKNGANIDKQEWLISAPIPKKVGYSLMSDTRNRLRLSHKIDYKLMKELARDAHFYSFS